MVQVLKAIAGEVAKGGITERHLRTELSEKFGFHPRFAKDLCRLMIGQAGGSHLFRRGPKGVLISHPGELTKLVRW
jgi:hypothetical protein